MVLGGQLPGRVDGRRNPIRKVESQKRKSAKAVLFFCLKKYKKHKKEIPFQHKGFLFYGYFLFCSNISCYMDTACGGMRKRIKGSIIILDSSMAEHPAVNRRVAGSSPARGVFYGPLVKGLRHRPFTAVTRVRIPHGS